MDSFDPTNPSFDASNRSLRSQYKSKSIRELFPIQTKPNMWRTLQLRAYWRKAGFIIIDRKCCGWYFVWTYPHGKGRVFKIGWKKTKNKVLFCREMELWLEKNQKLYLHNAFVHYSRRCYPCDIYLCNTKLYSKFLWRLFLHVFWLDYSAHLFCSFHTSNSFQIRFDLRRHRRDIKIAVESSSSRVNSSKIKY